jgi:uncharacterized membrane protein
MATRVSERTRGPLAATAPFVFSYRWTGVRASAAIGAVVAVILGVGWFGVALWQALARHAAFSTGRFDLEIYAQVVWNTAHGQPFATTLLKTNLNHLAEHVALVLIPLSWGYRVWPEPRLLLVVQQVGLALIGVPLYWFAARALKSGLQAALVLAAFYASPALAGVALDDFHAVALTGLPLAAGLALVLAGRPRLGAGIALISMFVEEEAALAVIGLGGLLFVLGRRALGLVVALLAALWIAAMVFAVMPAFHDPRTLDGAGGNRTLGHFADLRADPGAALTRAVPDRAADSAMWVVLPTAGLGLLAPAALIPALPSGAALLLQDRDDTFSRHWVLPLLVAIWFATVVGLSRVRPGLPRSAALALLVAATVFSYALLSPFPGGGRFDARGIEQDERSTLLHRAVERIPASAVVVASPNVVAHLANRPEVYVFPIYSHYAEELGWRKKRPEFYLLDLHDELTNRATVSERLNPLNADRPYHVWSAGPKVLVLSDRPTEPATLLGARFGDRFLLKGYDLEATGQSRRLILHWERYAELRGRYDRDLAISDAAGHRVHYEEDMALSAIHGSNKWQPGQRIFDEIALPNVGGPLTVRVAWVAQEKRQPFRLSDGSDAFEFVIPAHR